MAPDDAADDAIFLHVSKDDTCRFIDEMKKTLGYLHIKSYLIDIIKIIYV